MFTSSWYEFPFNLQPKSGNDRLVAGQVVIDGISKLGGDLEEWNPRVLSIGSKPVQGGVTDQPEYVPTPSPGAIPLELRGLYRGGGGVWIRRFWVPAYRRIEIDVSGFADIRVAIAATGSIGVGIWGTASNRLPPLDAHRDPVFWSETYATPATYAAPPGALWAMPSIPDPGFAWRTFSAAGVPVPFNVPLAPGLASEARSGMFTTSVANLTMLWGIRL